MIFLSNNDPLFNTIVLFVLIMTVIYIAKPRFLYDYDNNNFKQFGVDEGKTLLPIYVIAIILAIVLYLMFMKANMNNKIDNNINENITSNNRKTSNMISDNEIMYRPVINNSKYNRDYDNRDYDYNTNKDYNNINLMSNMISQTNTDLLMTQLKTQNMINKQILDRLDRIENFK